jgi:ATP synthase protein I
VTSEEPKSRWDRQPRPRAGAGWTIVSYLIGGMILYGGIGWLVGRWTGLAALFPVGMLLGLALALILVIFRFVRT